ncbi:zonadhesin-like [Atheta coriaria]|uniref:zonadhesin-like n=1 Tax=Dalotia coriaria TaxID=877792 RepID=UPI0031F40D92
MRNVDPRQSYHECYKNIVRTCQDKQVEKVRDIESIECLSGCFCDGPFIWDAETQKCVYPTECQNSKENQICSKDDPKSEFRVCQSSTKATCTDPNPLAINKDCRSECRCKEGYVFNEKTEKCMTLEDCVDHKSSMSSCDSNSTYSVCASACPKTCANAYGNKMALATCMACYEGCECKPNYLRTKDKRCVLIKDCPEQEILCPSDRQYKSCEHVIKTCSTNITNEDTCLRGCFCRDDMVQNANGRCIYPGECTNSSENRKCQKSDVNSHYEECQYVRRSCSDPNGANRRKSVEKDVCATMDMFTTKN